MSRIIMLIPTYNIVGLTGVSLGIIQAIEQKNMKPSIFKPIAQSQYSEGIVDATINIISNNYTIPCVEPISMKYAKLLLCSGKQDLLMEEIITRCLNQKKESGVMLVEGLVHTNQYQFATILNYNIAKILNAEIIFVLPLGNNSPEQFKKNIELVRSNFGGNKNENIIGIIIDELNVKIDIKDHLYILGISNFFNSSRKKNVISKVFLQKSSLPILGCIPCDSDLIATRAIDIAQHLNASIINEGDINIRHVKSIIFCACNLQNVLKSLQPESLLVISADRTDILAALALEVIDRMNISAVLLTEGYNIDPHVEQFYKHAFKTGLPMFSVQTNTWQTAINLQNFNLKIPNSDHIQIKKLQNYISKHIDTAWIRSLSFPSKLSHKLTPVLFRYQLTQLARQASKIIVLPEGDEPRTIKAASICAERGIAICVLLGKPNDIYRIATKQGIPLSTQIKIIDPEKIREKYIARLIELRKDKGMTETIARKQLEDNIVLGTMMLEQGEVDGLVSGAVHTTADTIRPPLQLLKTAPGSSLVSSVFFMLLPEQVILYGDCAINQNPTSEQLAEIAIQSADSATAFGIEPRVAMISYSTGNSSTGIDVEKVRKATFLAKNKRPDLMIDGPLQYDAAIIADVALLKAPNSSVAGKATVFIFPDLNTGNTTYKAVQRSANLISIGPMLQGMRKPVNDLSRGALVDDIVYTIAITAIQSNNLKKIV